MLHRANEFAQWLCPLYSQNEAQLDDIRECNKKIGVLPWALNMTGFQTWRLSSPGSKENLLWIRGAPRVGKTTVAGMFIDGLESAYPNSIMTYYFWNSGADTGIRDIIRTLSYQCALRNSTVRSRLESLKDSGFLITNHRDVSPLTKRLFQEPLCQIHQDVFIILDGIDEMDEELKETIKSLAEFSTCRTSSQTAIRLLILSRLHLGVKGVFPDFPTAVIGYHESQRNIQDYVSEVIAESENLQLRFRKAGQDALTYFSKHSGGTFIWTVTALDKLANAETTVEFLNLLQTLP
jgi:hypothetical protein